MIRRRSVQQRPAQPDGGRRLRQRHGRRGAHLPAGGRADGGRCGGAGHLERPVRRLALGGGILANELLKGTDLSLEDRITIMSAIGNHDESTGGATDPVSAALIIADKTDVRRNRVRDKDRAAFDIHDRVNYAVTEAKLKINKEKKLISLNLQIDESICTMYEYFDIFLGRMMMCRGAAEILNMKFRLTANGSKVL